MREIQQNTSKYASIKITQILYLGEIIINMIELNDRIFFINHINHLVELAS